jgi:hypothetical protein
MRDESLNKRAWLLMLTEGGRWSMAELADALRVQNSLSGRVWRMCQQGMIVRHEKGIGRSRVGFSVTRDCRIPHGVTLEDLIKCDVIKVKP